MQLNTDEDRLQLTKALDRDGREILQLECFDSYGLPWRRRSWIVPVLVSIHVP